MGRKSIEGFFVEGGVYQARNKNASAALLRPETGDLMGFVEVEDTFLCLKVSAAPFSAKSARAVFLIKDGVLGFAYETWLYNLDCKKVI